MVLLIIYEGKKLDGGYRIDLLLARSVILEIKPTDAIGPIHHAQLLTYMKLSGCRLGYLMNFNVPLFKTGTETDGSLTQHAATGNAQEKDSPQRHKGHKECVKEKFCATRPGRRYDRK